MKNLLLVVLAFVLLGSCGSRKNKEINTSNHGIPKKALLGELPKDNPDTQINSVRLEGKILTLEVSYSGGCEDQEFDLIGSQMIMKSLPPQRSVVLFRDSKGDVCREFLTRTIQFDITDLHHNKKAGQEIVLLIAGYKEHISFVFE